MLDNPATLARGPVYFRALVTNTGTPPLSGVGLTDSAGETLGQSTLAASEVATSIVVTVTALGGRHFDTAGAFPKRC